MNSNEYIITKLKRLVDLNANTVNFKLAFTVTATDGLEHTFQCVVMDQATLDTIDESDIQFKTVTGSLSGEVVADKNIYKNYLLILRADVPTTVRVDTQIEELSNLPIAGNVPELEIDTPSFTDFFSQHRNIIAIILLFLLVTALYYNNVIPDIGRVKIPKVSLLDKLKTVANTAT